MSSVNPMIRLLQTRRSVAPPALGAPGPGAAELEAMLGIGARVPDHGKLAPWRFLVFEGDARLRAGEYISAAFLADNPGAGDERAAIERNRLALAPVVIGVVSRAAPHVKIPEWEQVLSAGAVCQNLVIAANAMGYGASWLTQWYSYDRRVTDALGVLAHEKMAGFVHIGTPAALPADRTRPVLADLITRF